MLALLISAACNVYALIAVSGEAHGCWGLDKEVVAQGGPVTIIVKAPCNDSWDLRLQIDDREPVKLLEAGPSYHMRTSRLPGREDTLVLLYQDMTSPEGLEEVDEEPGTLRLVPVFNQCGSVRVTLFNGEKSLGTKFITVIPCAPEAHEAVELLRPKLGEKYRGQRDEILWTQLVLSPSFGVTPRLTTHEMEVLRQQFPIIKKHPDWAVIAEMHLARLEALYYVQQVSEKGGKRLRDDVESPEFPKIVHECMSRKLQSPFAQAIQDDLRDTSGMLTYLLKDRERERSATPHR